MAGARHRPNALGSNPAPVTPGWLPWSDFSPCGSGAIPPRAGTGPVLCVRRDCRGSEEIQGARAQQRSPERQRPSLTSCITARPTLVTKDQGFREFNPLLPWPTAPIPAPSLCRSPSPGDQLPICSPGRPRETQTASETDQSRPTSRRKSDGHGWSGREMRAEP